MSTEQPNHRDLGPDIRGGVTFVEMYHPDIKSSSQRVPEALVDHHRGRGWLLRGEKPSEPAPEPDATTEIVAGGPPAPPTPPRKPRGSTGKRRSTTSTKPPAGDKS